MAHAAQPRRGAGSARVGESERSGRPGRRLRVSDIAPSDDGATGNALTSRVVAATRSGWAWGWGKGLPPAEYDLTIRLFLSALGFTYLFAFGSLWVQLDGLWGSAGILPIADWLELARDQLGRSALWRVPTLFWLNASDAVLHAGCALGVVAALAAITGWCSRLAFWLMWLVYLSFASAGEIFLGYQWDNLLLEVGLLAAVLAPRGVGSVWRTPDARSRWSKRIVVWLLHWLLFRLMFESGLVKLMSGDDTWRSLTALDYHFFTQPIPTWTAYYAHHLPAIVRQAFVVMTFAIELVVPFLFFAPRRPRYFGCAAAVSFQLAIAATGNYGFFNFLTLVLCISLLDDSLLLRWVPSARTWLPGLAEPGLAAASRHLRRAAFVAFVVFTGIVTGGLDDARFTGKGFRFEAVGAMHAWVSPLRSFNSYGLFATMTTQRPEIELEGSRDGQSWEPYRFEWKPGELDRRPRFAGLHMPRLDWQMWFAALRTCQTAPWFHRFMLRLLEGSPEVLALLRENPFGDEPPAYLRSELYQYRFAREGPADGRWWERYRVGSYCPPVTVENGGLALAAELLAVPERARP